MTHPGSTVTDIDQTHVEALKSDIRIAYEECGPRFFTPHPTFGWRIFVIADDKTILPEKMCAKRGHIHRSSLHATITPEKLNRLIAELYRQGYRHIKMSERGGSKVEGRWISYRVDYYAGDENK